jgi:hypothetical protein
LLLQGCLLQARAGLFNRLLLVLGATAQFAVGFVG